jgi:hypothetical protein
MLMTYWLIMQVIEEEMYLRIHFEIILLKYELFTDMETITLLELETCLG